MYLPKPLYENLPLLYFFTSGFLLAYSEQGNLVLPALLFYVIACIVLVNRSANRRLDKDKIANPDKKLSKLQVLPEVIYEYLPYGYVVIALFFLMISKQSLVQFLAFCLVILGLRNLMYRHQNRTHKARHF